MGRQNPDRLSTSVSIWIAQNPARVYVRFIRRRRHHLHLNKERSLGREAATFTSYPPRVRVPSATFFHTI
jgi:hypothetical protein